MARSFSPTLRANSGSPLGISQVDGNFTGISAIANVASRTFRAASQAAMLALPDTPIEGDAAWRTDENKLYVFLGGSAGDIANWKSQASPARATVVHTTASLAANASEEASVVMAKTYLLPRIQTSGPARVRVYSTAAYRTADAARLVTVDPAGEHGVIAEVLTVTGNLTIDMMPVPTGTNMDTSPSSTAYIAIQNTDTVTAAVTVTLTFLSLE